MGAVMAAVMARRARSWAKTACPHTRRHTTSYGGLRRQKASKDAKRLHKSRKYITRREISKRHIFVPGIIPARFGWTVRSGLAALHPAWNRLASG
jgi:hypothetical protein